MLARNGLSVLLWDLDPQGGSSYFFNCQNKNNNTHSRLFDQYIRIYDVIHSTESYHIDVIGNDALFSDQFMTKASRIAALNFINHDLIRVTLDEIKDDYDICIMDCSPGRFLLHENIFNTTDLLLIPNIPAPLSVYCNNMLMDSLENKLPATKKILSFYNMVQAHKNLHKHFLDRREEDKEHILHSYIPFYTEIENITLSRESIFHQMKEFKTNLYYVKLWEEICARMKWDDFYQSKAIRVDFKTDSTITNTIEKDDPLSWSQSSVG